MIRTLIAILLVATFMSDDRDKGRKGNKAYHEKKYEEAARLFREGIAELIETSDPATRSGLYNNLGAALNRLELYDEAGPAFDQAVEASASSFDLARAAYNAGNTAFQAQDPQRALDYFRNALLADPENEDARFNYEFVRKLIEEQKQSGGSGDQQQQQEQQDENKEQQDQENEDQQQNQEQQEQQNQEQEPGDEQQENDQEREEQRDNMTPEQAEQILQALQNDEEELMRQVWRMKGKPRSVEKDW